MDPLKICHYTYLHNLCFLAKDNTLWFHANNALKRTEEGVTEVYANKSLLLSPIITYKNDLSDPTEHGTDLRIGFIGDTLLFLPPDPNNPALWMPVEPSENGFTYEEIKEYFNPLHLHGYYLAYYRRAQNGTRLTQNYTRNIAPALERLLTPHLPDLEQFKKLRTQTCVNEIHRLRKVRIKIEPMEACKSVAQRMYTTSRNVAQWTCIVPPAGRPPNEELTEEARKNFERMFRNVRNRCARSANENDRLLIRPDVLRKRLVHGLPFCPILQTKLEHSTREDLLRAEYEADIGRLNPYESYTEANTVIMSKLARLANDFSCGRIKSEDGAKALERIQTNDSLNERWKKWNPNIALNKAKRELREQNKAIKYPENT